MDPYNQYSQNNQRKSTSSNVNPRTNALSANNALEDANANTPANADTESSSNGPTQPQHADGFRTIPPNESKRNKLQRMAQKEMEDWETWKEANRPKPVQLTPERLGGGDMSLAEARERQLVELRQSKLKKKLKKEEMDRQKRQEEEEEIQRMKTKQREKAERQEERREQEEQLKREQHRQDHLRRTEQFLQRVESTNSAPVASSSATHTSSWARAQEYREGRRAEENTGLQLMKEQQRIKSEALEENQREQGEEKKRQVEQEHRRVNSAFLDMLQGGGARGAIKEEREEEHPSAPMEYSCDWGTQSQGPQNPLTPQEPDPAQGPSGWAWEADADYEWVVMKLQSNFPIYERAFLEDIVIQCKGDYQQAYELLQ